MSTSAARRERRLERYRAERMRLRQENEELRAALAESIQLTEEAQAHIEESDPEGLRARVAELEDSIREGAHRAAWEDEAAKLGIHPSLFEDLWTLDRPDLTADEPDPKALARHLRNSLKTRPGLVNDHQADDDDEPNDDQADDDDATNPTPTPNLFKLAPRREPDRSRRARPRDDHDDDEPNDDRGKPRSGQLRAAAGSGKGNPLGKNAESLADRVDREFRETGRTDPFRI